MVRPIVDAVPSDGSRCAFEDEVVLLHKGGIKLVAQLSCRECVFIVAGGMSRICATSSIDFSW